LSFAVFSLHSLPCLLHQATFMAEWNVKAQSLKTAVVQVQTDDPEVAKQGTMMVHEILAILNIYRSPQVLQSSFLSPLFN
jgi:hypothetical protein